MQTSRESTIAIDGVLHIYKSIQPASADISMRHGFLVVYFYGDYLKYQYRMNSQLTGKTKSKYCIQQSIGDVHNSSPLYICFCTLDSASAVLRRPSSISVEENTVSVRGASALDFNFLSPSAARACFLHFCNKNNGNFFPDGLCLLSILHSF